MRQNILSEYLYNLLDEMQTEKAKSTHVPNMVTRGELFGAIDKDVKAVLNKMFQEKKIKVHKTIHAPIQDFVELIKEDNGKTE